MKIVIAMKSNFAYERLKATIKRELPTTNIEFKENIVSSMQLEDICEFWSPHLAIVDQNHKEQAEMYTVLNTYDIPLKSFKSDYETFIREFCDELSLDMNTDAVEEEIDYHETEKPSQIVYRDRLVEKEVILKSYRAIPRKLIVVGSLWSGAGSTTLAVNLARSVAEREVDVSYIEHPHIKPFMFDYLAIDKDENETGTKYIDHAHEMRNKSKAKTKDKTWLDSGVTWFVNDPRLEPIDDFKYDELLKLLYKVNSTVVILDVSNQFHSPSVQKILHEADEILVCVEPNPIKVEWLTTITDKENQLATKQTKEKLAIDYLNKVQANEDVRYEFVTMKHSNKIDQKQWNENLEKRPIVTVPNIPYEDYISSVWQNTLLYEQAEYKTNLDDVLKPLLTRILPRDYVELKDKPKRLSSIKKHIPFLKG